MMISVKRFFLVALLAASTPQAAKSSYMPDFSKLSNWEKAELAASLARGSMGATNGYALHTNSSYKNVTEICAKITTIIHDSLNVYNIKNKGEKNIHQIGRLIHDSSSLLYEASKMISSSSDQTTSCPFTTANINQLAVLHYILPLVEAAAGSYIVTSSTDNSAHARKNRALAQGMLSLAHYIDDASKANGDIFVLYPRITLALGSLAALSYDFSRDDAVFKKEEKKSKSEVNGETTKENDKEKKQDAEEPKDKKINPTDDAENDEEGEEAEEVNDDVLTNEDEDNNTEDGSVYEDHDDSSFIPESDDDMEEESDSEDDSYPERIFKDTDTKGSEAPDVQTQSESHSDLLKTPPLSPEVSDDEDGDYKQEVGNVESLVKKIKFTGKKTRESKDKFVKNQHQEIINFAHSIYEEIYKKEWPVALRDHQFAVLNSINMLRKAQFKNCFKAQEVIKELHKNLYKAWRLSSEYAHKSTKDSKAKRVNSQLANQLNNHINNLFTVLREKYSN